jgi:hypothetical protein
VSPEVCSVVSVHAEVITRENLENYAYNLKRLRAATQFCRFSRYSRAAYRESHSLLLLIVCKYKIYNCSYLCASFLMRKTPSHRENRENPERPMWMLATVVCPPMCEATK